MTSPSEKRYPAARSLGQLRKRVDPTGRDRLRRLALEPLEARTLMAVLPPPTILYHSNVANTADDTQSPTVTVDPLDPTKAVAVWSRTDTAGDLPGTLQEVGELAYTTNGGQNWTKLTSNATLGLSLPAPAYDPSQGAPTFDAKGNPTYTTVYPFTTDTSAAFDRQHNFYVVSDEHTIDYKSGAIVLQKYNFTNPTPNLTLANKIVHQWYDPTGGQGDQAFTPTLAVDTSAGNAVVTQPTGTTSGITVGPDNNVYVASDSLNQVDQYLGSNGQFTSVFASGSDLFRPDDVAFDPTSGDLFISNLQTGRVIQVDGTTGASLGEFDQSLVAPRRPATRSSAPTATST